MKRFFVFLLLASLLATPTRAIEPLRDDAIPIAAPSAILMERSSGTVLYEKNAYEHLSPASVTKIMTMLLIVEAVESGIISLEDSVTASARAAGMGGSQIWLEEGEVLTVAEMLKCVAVVSANDCAVALAETLCGSEAAFTARMNRRATELGLQDTVFRNCTGLSGPGEHYSSAWDIAVMSRELLSHAWIRDYTTIWMDTIRGGEFGLSNTNKLVHGYHGCTGLKTGYTSEAMFCLAASAERDGVEFIAVVLHGDSSADRFAAARTLLDYAFANYALVSLLPPESIAPIPVEMGMEGLVNVAPRGNTVTVAEKAALRELTMETELPSAVTAPVEAGQVLGQVTLRWGDRVLSQLPLTAAESVERRSRGRVYRDLLGQLFSLNGAR